MTKRSADRQPARASTSSAGQKAAPTIRSAAKGKLYQEVATLLRERIRAREVGPGDRLPTIEMLATDLGVSSITVRAALDELDAEGLVERRQGSGTFVRDTAETRGLLASELMVRLEAGWGGFLHPGRDGARVTIRRLSDGIGQPVIEERDGLGAPEGYRLFRRLHASDGVPYAVITVHLAQSIYRLAPDRFQAEALLPALDQVARDRLASVRQTLRIGAATPEQADWLGIGVNAPVGVVRRAVRDREGQILLLGEATYRGDLVRLEGEVPL